MKSTVCAEPLWNILQTLGEGKGDYGMDTIKASEMHIDHSDFISHAKAEKEEECVSPFYFWSSFRYFVCFWIVGLEILLKADKTHLLYQTLLNKDPLKNTQNKLLDCMLDDYMLSNLWMHWIIACSVSQVS